FATVIVGLLLYGKYLPPGMRRRAWRGVLINVVLLALLSWGLRSYLSHWGHLGGALAGALTALVLHVQRFGPPGVRWLALAALAPLPWAGLVVIDRARARSEDWHHLEDRDFTQRSLRRVNRTNRRALEAFDQNVYGVLEGTHHTRRPPHKVEDALE